MNLGGIAAEDACADIQRVVVVQDRETHAVGGWRALVRQSLHEVADPHRVGPGGVVDFAVDGDRGALQADRAHLFVRGDRARVLRLGRADRGYQAERQETQSRASASNTRPRSYCELMDPASSRIAARMVSSIRTVVITAISSSDSS